MSQTETMEEYAEQIRKAQEMLPRPSLKDCIAQAMREVQSQAPMKKTRLQNTLESEKKQP